MEQLSNRRSSSRSRRLISWIVALGIFWGMGFLLIGLLEDPNPEDLTVLISAGASGLYTLGLWITRSIWRPRLGRRPLTGAALLGSLNAAVVETIFLVFEKVTGAEGVAAHPNLLIDLLITMPWYVLMVITFTRVQNRQRFSPAIVLLLGAIYEFGADGVVGSLFAGLLFGDAAPFTLEYWLLLCGFGFWLFVPIYSSIVLAPSWLIEQIPPAQKPAIPAWLDALKPLIWLIPFSLYALTVIFILGALS